MENKISASEFFKCWVINSGEIKNEIYSLWKTKKKELTKLILDPETGIINNVASYFNLKNYSYGYGYYYVDSVFYMPDEDRVIFGNQDNTWLRKIRVAIEHENNFRYLFTEYCRLIITKTELKVLISYPIKGDKWKNEINELKELLADKNGIQLIKNNSFLLILAFENELKNAFTWRGFVYNKNEWEEVINYL